MLETKTFFTAKNDKVFKTIMADEDNKKMLIKFLERILDKKIEELTYLKNELTINYPLEKRKTVDVLVKTEDLYIHLELNNGYNDYLHMRNFCYFTNIYSKKTKAGRNYNLKEIFIQINFTYKNIIKGRLDKNKILEDKELLRIYKVMDKDLKTYIENIEIWEFNMDRIMQIWYDNNESEIEKYKHLIMLDSNLDELEKLSKGDDLVEEFKEEIKELNENETYTSWLTPEEDAEFILNTEKSISYEQGEKNKQIEIAKNLLKTDLKVEDISKATGLSIEEVAKIKNEI